MQTRMVLAGCLAGMVGAAAAFGASSSSSSSSDESALSAGVRYHADHKTIAMPPYKKGDLSYQLFYEYHNDLMFWQLGLGFTPSVGETTNDVDYALTPQLNLIIKDGIFRAGVGGLISYVEYSGDTYKDDWSRFYWQVLLGVSIPLPAHLSIAGYAYYPFRDLKDFKDFEVGDLEYAALVGLTF